MEKTIKVVDKQTVDAMQRAIDEITEELRDVKERLEETAKISQIINSSVVTEPGFIADARLMNPSLESSPLYRINQGLAYINNSFKRDFTINNGNFLDEVIAETSTGGSISLYLVAVSGEAITGVPNGLNYSVGLIINRYNSERVVVLFDVFGNTNATFAVNLYSRGRWLGWNTF